MKRIYALLLSLILLLGISACGARGEKKEFTSFLPPKSATVHEDIQVDETNHITIVDTQTIVPNPDKPDEKILIVTYDWKNDSEKQKITYGSFLITAKQDGVSLKPDLKHVEDKFKLVRPRRRRNAAGHQQGFVLLSDGEVTLPIKGIMGPLVDGVPQNSYPVECR